MIHSKAVSGILQKSPLTTVTNSRLARKARKYAVFSFEGYILDMLLDKKNPRTNLVKNVEPLRIPMHRNLPSTSSDPGKGTPTLDPCFRAGVLQVCSLVHQQQQLEEFTRNGGSGAPPQTC